MSIFIETFIFIFFFQVPHMPNKKCDFFIFKVYLKNLIKFYYVHKRSSDVLNPDNI